MGSAADREQLVRDVVRLRRAERLCRANEDIVAVRAQLERRIGPTVRRAMAARLLGVSQTALDRWIARGEIPCVVTPTAGREVPLHALVELIEAVEEAGRAGGEDRPLASVLRRRRAAARGLDPERVFASGDRTRDPEHGHRRAELASLAYHRVVAQRLDERIVDDALHRLRRWRSEGKLGRRYAEQWERALSRSLPEIAELIGADGSQARDLRQSSPFAGALDESERRRILELIDR